MKTLSLFVFIALLCSCGPSAAEREAHKKDLHSIDLNYSNSDYKVIKIGDCEYISGWCGSGDGGPYLTHKGDCSNPIHIYRQE